MNDNKAFVTKGKTKLLNHLLTALKDRWILSTLMFLITIMMAIILMINIKAIEYITALLIAKSFSDAFLNLNADQIIAAYPQLAEFREIIVEIINNLNESSSEEYIQQFVQQFFYDYVYYSQGIVYVIVFNYHLNLYSLTIIMILDIAVVVIMSYLVYIISGFVSSSYEQKLKTHLIAKLIDQDLHYFSENKTGELISVLIKESQILSKHIKDAPVNYCLSITTIFVSSIMMFSIDWQLALYVFGLLAICLVLVFLFTFITIKATKKTEQLNTKVNNDLNEKIYSMRLIKASGTYNQEKTQFNDAIKEVSVKNKRKLFISEIPGALIVGGIGSFSMASVIFGVFLYYNETQSLISILTAFTTGVIVMVMPILQLREVIAAQPAANEAAKNVSKVLESEIEINKHESQNFNGEVKTIELKNVSFAYPKTNKVILNKLNIKLEQGKKYAFVGPTGSGKSTIAKLMLRFYDPTTGEIIINNKENLKNLNLKSWLDNIGYVDQEPQILSGTVISNIKYGLENKNNEEAIEAAKKAKLHDLIMSLPDGYDTILFERGNQLSGGQKQRLVIARLLLKDPQILILDEATSALDNIVEKEIQLELEKLMVGRTTISIAHRLSTIKTFDKIFVLDPNEGVIQTGNYEQLIKETGLFKTLYEITK